MHSPFWRSWSRQRRATKDDLEQMERRIIAALERIENKTMKTLTDIESDVADVTTLEDSLITLTSGLQEQLKAALAGVLAPDLQTKVEGIFSNLEARKTALAAALLKNTPAQPPAVTPPPAAG